MRNVHTQVAHHNGAIDIAIEKPGTADKEVRYDVQSVEILGPGSAKVTSKGGKTYTVKADRPRTRTVSEAEAAVHLTRDEITRFALGQSVFKNGRTFYSVGEYARSLEGQTDPNALAVVRVSPRLVTTLGFTPQVAYKG